ncbi:MAG: hypothetical protein K0S08_849 [Gammaproteobacteria bacterium]|jgi:hypothetical protein|nr:hypothetical protein [Gammaproteobacteria bacterium]
MMSAHFYELLTIIDVALTVGIMFLSSGFGWATLAVFGFVFYYLWKVDQKKILQQVSYPRLLIANSLTRFFLVALTFFMLPWTVLSCAIGAIGSGNAYYYKLNLAAVASYFILVIIALIFSRKLEAKQRIKTASLILFLPFISVLISFYSITRI